MWQTSYSLICFTTLLLCCLCEKKCTKVPKKCTITKYRSFDGSCNNLKYPDWGMTSTRFGRLLPPEYGDGISTFRRAKSGLDLPNARKVSEKLFPGNSVPDKVFTLAQMQYGQIIAHDMGMSAALSDNLCCTEDLQYLPKIVEPSNCAPIAVPRNDPFYSKMNAKCISFARTSTDRDHKCGERNKPVQQINQVNSYLDLSIIYGNDKKTNDYIRLKKGGLLKTRKDMDQEWPLTSKNIKEACIFSKKNDICFFESDTRINQHPQLALLHIIFYREHNRIAKILAKLNPQWNDNTLFEEARKINIAQHQFISIYEWLPLFVEGTNWDENKPKGYVDVYDPNVKPNTLIEHNNAVFRIHTQIAGHLHLVEEDREFEDTLRLSDWYFRPHILEEHNNFDALARGLTTQMGMAADEYHDHEITHYWFRKGSLGYDLRAIDIQRSRDSGIASYNKARALCNLSVAKEFHELKDIPKHIVIKLAKLYETTEDIDLIVGGAVEKIPHRSTVGPTFRCMILKQFDRTMAGDRFWFENSGETGFTLGQLREIRKASFARLICDNAKSVKKMQPQGFIKLGGLNNLVDCDSLPAVNLKLWKT